MADTVFYSRSHGVSATGVADQYADGKAAKVWKIFIGDRDSRTQNYKNFIIGLLKERGCRRILDIACGTGVDSIMLLEAGFDVTSVDASDKMLKSALKTRWNRRKDPKFDQWVIEEANWITLHEDVKNLLKGGFDAVICLGNSFAHLLDSYGDQREQKEALRNFEMCIKPGGLLLIDHRNFDLIVNEGRLPPTCIYYNSKHTLDIKVSTLTVSGENRLVMFDYKIDTSSVDKQNGISEFRLSYYPHKYEHFKEMLMEAFHGTAKIKTYGDFKELSVVKDPGFYIHVVEKK